MISLGRGRKCDDMKPILFSTPMVQAILAGRKTQTRRVIKPQHVRRSDGRGTLEKIPLNAFADEVGLEVIAEFSPRCPGDILYVRETWLQEEYPEFHYVYKASCPKPEDYPEKWRPSIHMPRAAARIFLRVTDVRVERLQQITYGDCCAEGVFDREDLKSCAHGSIATERFRELWNSLNAKRGYGWGVNPWVWVYEFERIESEEA